MDFVKDQVVLVDTNVIIEAHRVRCWAAIASYFSVETVVKCIEETQTGAQNRSPEQNIDQAALTKSLGAIHTVTEIQRAEFLLRQKQYLDAGELDLLAHAASRQDVWVISSPDKAAMRVVHSEGWLDRLVSLESLCTHLKLGVGSKLGRNYTKEWHAVEAVKLRMGL